jgi:hypothetical protein
VVLVDEEALLGGANRRPRMTCASSRGGPIGIRVKGIWVGGRWVQHATETMDLLNPTPTQHRVICRSPRSDCRLPRLPTDAHGAIWVSQSCLGRLEWLFLREARTPIRGAEFRRAKTAKMFTPPSGNARRRAGLIKLRRGRLVPCNYQHGSLHQTNPISAQRPLDRITSTRNAVRIHPGASRCLDLLPCAPLEAKATVWGTPKDKLQPLTMTTPCL